MTLISEKLRQDKGKQDISPAFALVEHVWGHNREATGFSWTRLNGSMFQAVGLAISAGLRFDRDDFTRFAAQFRINRWCGDDGGERWYSQAVDLDHPSACQSYEAWRGRRPFILDGRRLCVGAQLQWSAQDSGPIGTWTVSSFSDDQSYVTAIQRTYVENTWKVKRRCRITHADIYARNARMKIWTQQKAERERAISEAESKARNEGRWFKVLRNGRSFHGGDFKWSLPRKTRGGEWTPGEWHEVAGDVVQCSVGFHVTKIPAAWFADGSEVFEAEIEGPENFGDHRKTAAKRCRLLKRLDEAELEAIGIVQRKSAAKAEGRPQQ